MAAKKNGGGKPKRTRAHELGEIARLRFEMTRPIAWVVHKIDGSDDYGRDGFVEVFENGEATGDEFFTQYKGTDGGGPSKARVRTATLNLWQDQPSPVLVLNWSEREQKLYYQWAHLLALHTVKPNQVDRTVPVPNVWTDTTPNDLVSEVRAYRAARTLVQHFPIDLRFRGDSIIGESSADVVAAVIDLISPLREFEVSFGEPRIPFLQIEFQDRGMNVSLSGAPVRTLTYGGALRPPPEVLAADALFAIALAVGATGGSPEVGASLMALAVPTSMMAVRAGRLADAVAILASRGFDLAVLSLLRRSLFIEGDPNAPEALQALRAIRLDLSDSLANTIASDLESASTSWRRPGAALCWAAQVLHLKDKQRSLNLWERAVSLDPAYEARPQYWREVGGLLFLEQRYQESAAKYRRAVNLRDESARPFLGDALMWSGEYAQALHEYERSSIREGDENAEWRRNWLALDMMVNAGRLRQERDWFAAAAKWSEISASAVEPTDEAIDEVLNMDALFGWAHWAKAPRDSKKGFIPIDSVLFATIALPVVAPIWQELIDSALRVGARQTARDAMLLARRFCRTEFLKLLHTDAEHVRPSHRELLLALWGALDDADKFNGVVDDEVDRQLRESELNNSVDDDDADPLRAAGHNGRDDGAGPRED